MSEWKCPFCGSDKLRLETPYIELGEDGQNHPVMTYCCMAQKHNARYVKKNYGPDEAPDMEDVSKW